MNKRAEDAAANEGSRSIEIGTGAETPVEAAAENVPPGTAPVAAPSR